MASLSPQRQTVCGLCIHICSEFEREQMNYGALASACVQHNARTDKERMSTLIPADAEIITIITSDAETFILFPADSSDNVFYARPRYAGRVALGVDTVVHGWLYTDKRGVVRIGVFDATRVKGAGMRTLSTLERHTAVHSLMHSFGCEHHVHYHWSGHESHCMRPFHQFKLDYDISGIARLSPDMGAPDVVRVLPCLLTGTKDLAPRPRPARPAPHSEAHRA